MHRQVDTHSPIPIRRQLTEPRKDVSEAAASRETRPRRAPGSWSSSSASIRMRVHAIEETQTAWVAAALPLTAATPSSIPPLPGPKAPRGDPMLQKDFRKRGWDKMPAQDTADYAVARACADGLELLTKK